MKRLSTILIALTLFLSNAVSAQEPLKYKTFESDVQVIDVRTDGEWKGGHHPDAMHLPHTSILEGKGFEQLDKNKPVVLYCRSGGRAEQAKNYLEAQGFTNVKNLGGISDLVIPENKKDKHIEKHIHKHKENHTEKHTEK
jgi:phage shock protein E